MSPCLLDRLLRIHNHHAGKLPKLVYTVLTGGSSPVAAAPASAEFHGDTHAISSALKRSLAGDIQAESQAVLSAPLTLVQEWNPRCQPSTKA